MAAALLALGGRVRVLRIRLESCGMGDAIIEQALCHPLCVRRRALGADPVLALDLDLNGNCLTALGVRRVVAAINATCDSRTQRLRLVLWDVLSHTQLAPAMLALSGLRDITGLRDLELDLMFCITPSGDGARPAVPQRTTAWPAVCCPSWRPCGPG
jgi:hypothetical protein